MTNDYWQLSAYSMADKNYLHVVIKSNKGATLARNYRYKGAFVKFMIRHRLIEEARMILLRDWR